MYKIEESALELFNNKMFESFLRNLTYENYKKYPLVNMNYTFLQVFAFVKKLCSEYMAKGIQQKGNISFWIELNFLLSFDFLDNKEFSNLNDSIDFNEIHEIGEIDFSNEIYQKIKNISGFDDDNYLKIFFEESKNLDKDKNIFKGILKKYFLDYFNIFDEDLFWNTFFDQYSEIKSLDQILILALRLDLRKRII